MRGELKMAWKLMDSIVGMSRGEFLSWMLNGFLIGALAVSSYYAHQTLSHERVGTTEVQHIRVQQLSEVKIEGRATSGRL